MGEVSGLEFSSSNGGTCFRGIWYLNGAGVEELASIRSLPNSASEFVTWRSFLSYANLMYSTNQFESLLGDGLALDSSVIGDEKLGSAVLPVAAGASHILIECPADTEFT